MEGTDPVQHKRPPYKSIFNLSKDIKKNLKTIFNDDKTF